MHVERERPLQKKQGCGGVDVCDSRDQSLKLFLFLYYLMLGGASVYF